MQVLILFSQKISLSGKFKIVLCKQSKSEIMKSWFWYIKRRFRKWFKGPHPGDPCPHCGAILHWRRVPERTAYGKIRWHRRAFCDECHKAVR